MAIFPEEMTNTDLTLEGVTAKLTFFQLQIQLCHWQTTSFAEHKATDKMYDFLNSFKDEVVEKLMGYTNRRVKVFTLQPLTSDNALTIVNSIIAFAYALEMWAESKQYCDIENLAQSLSGEAAQVKYLLSLK